METASSNKRKKMSSSSTTTATTERKSSSNFMRVFSEEDELDILNAYNDIVKENPDEKTPAEVTSLLWERVGGSLSCEIKQNQLVEKLRKLKIKYKKQLGDGSLIKTSHQREVFELACKIWGHEDDSAAASEKKAAPRSSTIERKRKMKKKEDPEVVVETLTPKPSTQTEQYPYLMEEVPKLPGMLGMRETWKGLQESELARMNEQWKVQRTAEAKLFLEKTELIREQTKMVLEVLVSSCSEEEEEEDEEEED